MRQMNTSSGPRCAPARRGRLHLGRARPGNQEDGCDHRGRVSTTFRGAHAPVDLMAERKHGLSATPISFEWYIRRITGPRQRGENRTVLGMHGCGGTSVSRPRHVQLLRSARGVRGLGSSTRTGLSCALVRNMPCAPPSSCRRSIPTVPPGDLPSHLPAPLAGLALVLRAGADGERWCSRSATSTRVT